jgi:DNA-binding response OmpR family regulator
MSLPLIIYFGKPGLESQVFQSYMVSSGYQVQVVGSCDGATSALDANPDAIAVIAVDQDPQGLIHQAEILRAHAGPSSHIFIISPDEALDLHLSGVQVIPRPYRLSELVRRIRALIQDPKQN